MNTFLPTYRRFRNPSLFRDFESLFEGLEPSRSLNTPWRYQETDESFSHLNRYTWSGRREH